MFMLNRISCLSIRAVFFFIKKVFHISVITGFFCSTLSSCKFSESEHKTDVSLKKATALEVVENAINTAGTLKKWQNIASLKYTKKSRLLLENGDIESEVTQVHHYTLTPRKSIRIAWAVGKDSFLITKKGGLSQKFKNNILIEQGKSVASAVNSSLYVIGMPFKLLDKGTVLAYEGLRHTGGDTTNVVKATYDPQIHENHSTKDVWWYHFDKNTGAFLSSMVYHEPTYALIENTSVTKEKGLIFPKTRKSYRCNEVGEKRFLRAEFWYTDYSVTFLED